MVGSLNGSPCSAAFQARYRELRSDRKDGTAPNDSCHVFQFVVPWRFDFFRLYVITESDNILFL